MIWVFGYGSLMWNPGFAVAERRPAVLRGYHRAYMMYSTRNRGTPDCLGPVLSLAPGGECVGMAMRVEPGKEPEALEYLDKREGVGRAHRRVLMPLYPHHPGQGAALAPGQPLVGHAYLPILSYSNYIWGVPPERQAELVARGVGKMGTSHEYLRLLLEQLAQIQVREPTLEALFTAACQCGLVEAPPTVRPAEPPAAAGGDVPSSRSA